MGLVSVEVASQTEVGSHSEISTISSAASASLWKLNTPGRGPHSPAFKAQSPDTNRPPLYRRALATCPENAQCPSPKRARPTPAQARPLPIDYTLCNVEDLVVLIANMVSELIQKNDRLPLKSSGLTRFHSRFVHWIRHCCCCKVTLF
jgi:hypothetical protein